MFARLQLRTGMSNLTHVPQYKEKWVEWFRNSFRFLQWFVHEYLTEKGKYQLYAATKLEQPNSVSATPSRRKLTAIERAKNQNVDCTGSENVRICEVKKIAGRFHNNFMRNYGSLLHRFSMFLAREASNPSDPTLSKRNEGVVASIKDRLQTLGPGTFHTYRDVIKPMLRKWRGGIFLEADSTVEGKMMGELSVSLYYLLELQNKLHGEVFEMQTEDWSVLSGEKQIQKMKLIK